MAEQDSTALVAESADAPTASDDEQLFEIGGDLVGADDSEPAESVSETNNGTPEFDPDDVDWLRVDPETLPESYRHLGPMAKRMQATFTKNNQELKNRGDKLAQLERQISDRYALLQQQQQNAQPTQDEYADLKQRLIDSGDNEAAQGIDIVRDIYKREVGTRIEDMANQQHQLMNTVKLLAAHLVSQKNQSTNTQWDSLGSEYGSETVQQYRPAAEALMRTNNPATGKPYDAATALKTVAGLLQQEAAQLRETDQRIKNTARQRVKQTSPVQVNNGNGEVSDSELIHGLQSIGFE